MNLTHTVEDLETGHKFEVTQAWWEITSSMQKGATAKYALIAKKDARGEHVSEFSNVEDGTEIETLRQKAENKNKKEKTKTKVLETEVSSTEVLQSSSLLGLDPEGIVVEGFEEKVNLLNSLVDSSASSTPIPSN